MLYKLYKTRYPAGNRPDLERFKEFQKIYKEHGVKVIGGWQNVNDPQETWFMTAYRDKAHFDEALAKMQADPKYMEMSKKLQEARDSIEVTTLELVPDSPEA
ncbi:MAG: hypothetical protein ACE5I5_06720 [Candidatus Heimdallarchaeota archaeon]